MAERFEPRKLRRLSAEEARFDKVEPDVLVGLVCERGASKPEEDVGLHQLKARAFSR